MPETLRERILTVRERVDHAVSRAGRRDDVTLELAVKTRTAATCVEAARTLADLGLPVVLGHNHVQEMVATAPAIHEVPGAEVHLIGSLQTNKINHALAHVDLVETVHSTRLVAALDQRASRWLPVFIEVNVSGEATKHGCLPAEVDALVDAVADARHLTLAGFMTVGLNSTEEAPVRRAYAHLRSLRDRTAERLGVPDDELALSMGMSRDLEWAILEGATLVRVGTDVFGPR